MILDSKPHRMIFEDAFLSYSKEEKKLLANKPIGYEEKFSSYSCEQIIHFRSFKFFLKFFFRLLSVYYGNSCNAIQQTVPQVRKSVSSFQVHFINRVGGLSKAKNSRLGWKMMGINRAKSTEITKTKIFENKVFEILEKNLFIRFSIRCRTDTSRNTRAHCLSGNV